MLGTPPRVPHQLYSLTYLERIVATSYYSVISYEVYKFFYKDLDISVFIRIFTLYNLK